MSDSITILEISAAICLWINKVYNVSEGPFEGDLDDAMAGILQVQHVHDLQTVNVGEKEQNLRFFAGFEHIFCVAFRRFCPRDEHWDRAVGCRMCTSWKTSHQNGLLLSRCRLGGNCGEEDCWRRRFHPGFDHRRNSSFYGQSSGAKGI